MKEEKKQQQGPQQQTIEFKTVPELAKFVMDSFKTYRKLIRIAGANSDTALWLADNALSEAKAAKDLVEKLKNRKPAPVYAGGNPAPKKEKPNAKGETGKAPDSKPKP